MESIVVICMHRRHSSEWSEFGDRSDANASSLAAEIMENLGRERCCR